MVDIKRSVSPMCFTGKMVKKKLLEETDSAFQSTDSTPQGVIMRNNE